MKIGIIYKATNILNNKCYLGQTIKTLEQRKKRHLNMLNRKSNKSNNKFYNALRKYSNESNWKWEIIFENVSKEDLDWYEMWTIQMFDSYNNGYNSTFGGNSNNIGIKLSDEHKLKISKNHKGMSGKHHTKETIMKISQSRIGDKNPVKKPGVREKISNTLKGNIPWNKGLTMKDPRVAKNTEKANETIRKQWLSGQRNWHKERNLI